MPASDGCGHRRLGNGLLDEGWRSWSANCEYGAHNEVPVRNVVARTDPKYTVEKHWLARGDYLRDYRDEDEEALAAYDEALRLNPSVRDAWYGKAHVLNELKRYNEALHACDEALRIDPMYFWVWYSKGNALTGLKRYEEALQAYDEALRASDEKLQLPAVFSSLWTAKGSALASLKRYEEALVAYDEAIRLAPFSYDRDLVREHKKQVLKTMKQETRQE